MVEEPILFTSIQAPNQDFIVRLVADFVGRRLGVTAAFAGQPTWQEREALLDTGRAQVGWICGAPYVRKVERAPGSVVLLAAPVMVAARYRDRPIYFSDVVVRRDSPFQFFADLRGASWSYNEPNSQSGYTITRYHLATLGEWSGYFGRVVAAGSHQRSLAMVLSGDIDASAIDSTVLEQAIEERPEIADQIRVIEVFGPSPIPPWVASGQTPLSLQQAIRGVLLVMHEDEEGQALLAQGGLARFAPVSDSDYDPIRHMARLAEQVSW